MTLTKVFTDHRVRIVATFVLDIALIAGCATILWNSGGENVVSGSPIMQVACFALATALLAARHGLYVAHRASNSGFPSIRAEQVIALLDLVALAALVSAWIVTNSYFLGWVATFGAATLCLASIWQLLSALISQPAIAPHRARIRARLADRVASLASLRSLTGAFAIVALAVLTEIHQWSSVILSGLIVLISAAILFAVVVRAWVVAISGHASSPTT